MDAWVYELFMTTLDADGFLAENVLDLYHGRGAFEVVLADEDVEEDPDRWYSYTECGQELWQITCQRVWNLRLSPGHAMQGGQIRDIEWVPPQERPPLLSAMQDTPDALREQCLGRGAKGNRTRRVSAVHRLLPRPSSVEPQAGVLGSFSIRPFTLFACFLLSCCASRGKLQPLGKKVELLHTL